MPVDEALPALIRALPQTPAEVPAHLLRAPGCEVLFLTAQAGTELPMHSHDTDNATVVVSGETVVITEAGERRVRAGTWYLTSPGEPHAIRFDVDTVQIELRFAVR
jgi:quercetin dioxygenase-like cupin family protein